MSRIIEKYVGEKIQKAMINVINILMFIQGLKFGGLEKIVYDLMLNLKKNKKIKVEACCYDETGYFADKLIKKKYQGLFFAKKTRY